MKLLEFNVIVLRDLPWTFALVGANVVFFDGERITGSPCLRDVGAGRSVHV